MKASLALMWLCMFPLQATALFSTWVAKKDTYKYKPSPCGTGEDELHTGERPGQRDTLGDYRKCGELKDLAEIMDRKRWDIWNE